MEQDASTSYTISETQDYGDIRNPDRYDDYFDKRGKLRPDADLSPAQIVAKRQILQNPDDANIGDARRFRRAVKDDTSVQDEYKSEQLGQLAQFGSQTVSQGSNGNVFDTARSRYEPMNQAQNINF